MGASRVGTRETPAQLLARIRALRVTDATAAVQAPSRPSLRVLARALHENIDVFGRSWEAAVHREGKATTEGRTRRRAALRQSGPLPPSARSASPTTCGESGTLRTKARAPAHSTGTKSHRSSADRRNTFGSSKTVTCLVALGGREGESPRHRVQLRGSGARQGSSRNAEGPGTPPAAPRAIDTGSSSVPAMPNAPEFVMPMMLPASAMSCQLGEPGH